MKFLRFLIQVYLWGMGKRWTLILIFIALYFSSSAQVGDLIEQSNNNRVYREVDSLAQFPWGEDSLQSFIQNHLQEVYDENGDKVTGIVGVKFTVTRAGVVESPYVFKSHDKRLNKAALEVIRKIPVFQPAYKDDRTVNSLMTGIVHFR